MSRLRNVKRSTNSSKKTYNMPLFPIDQEYTLILRAFNKGSLMMTYDMEEIYDIFGGRKKGYEIMQWIGHYDDSVEKKKVFVADLCEVMLQNEFGSTTTHKAIVGFNPSKASYEYEIFDGAPSLAGRLVSAVVIGNLHETPEIFKNPHGYNNQTENQED